MMRRVATALVGTAVLAAVAGCAYQQPSIYLPDVTPRGGGSSSIQVYPSYGSGSGYGSTYGYGYGSPYGYQSGYGFNEPYYAGQAPYPYGYYRYPYPYRYVVVPCRDNNSDGRCDRRPPKDHDHHDGDGHGNRADGDGRNGHGGHAPVIPPRYVIAPANPPPTTPVPAPVAQQPARPAPVVQQPPRVRPDSRRAMPPVDTSPREPRVGRPHAPITVNDSGTARPVQDP